MMKPGDETWRIRGKGPSSWGCSFEILNILFLNERAEGWSVAQIFQALRADPPGNSAGHIGYFLPSPRKNILGDIARSIA